MDFSLRTNVYRLVYLFLLFAGLYYAKPFLVPVAFGAMFSMLLLPVAKRLERIMNKALANLICVIGLIAVITGIVVLLSWQVSGLASNASKMEQQITRMTEKVKQQVSTTLGIPPQKQQQMLKQQQSSAPSKIGSFVTGALQTLAGTLANFVLVMVYIFLFLYYRAKLKGFVLKKMPPESRDNTKDIIDKSQDVAGKYISGLALMIVCLWILYGIGFSIVGVKHALFFAILCGLLEIIPFVGNITGTTLTALMVLAQGGDTTMLLGVIATYAIVQTFQSYVLEPLIVGSNVNINPLFTILVIVLGETVWGVPGMILAIPLLAIVKIVCDHVPELQPYGYLFGENKKEQENKWADKLKGLFSKNKSQESN